MVVIVTLQNILPSMLSSKVVFPVTLPIICWGADKSLSRPTSRCHRLELIVSLERGVCSCAKLQVFSCYIFLCLVRRLKGSMSGDTQFQQQRDMSCHQGFYPARRGTEGNSCHFDRNIRWTCTVVCHHQKLDDPKQWPPQRLLIKFTS